MTPGAALMLLRELRVRQAELETENAELRRDQLRLTEARDRYVELFEFAPYGYFTLDAARTIIEVNLTAARMLGTVRTNLIGRRLDTLVPESLRDSLCRHFDRVCESQTRQVLSLKMCRPDGTYVYGDLETVPVRGARATIPRYWCVLSDVTELRTAEQALRESEQRFRRLSDANIIGIVTADMTAIRSANDEFLRMGGYSRADLESGQVTWQRIASPDWAVCYQEALAELTQQGWCQPREMEYLRPDGNRVPILIGSSVLTRDPLTWISFVLDLTTRKQVEAALAKSEERLRLALRAAQMATWDAQLPDGATVWNDEHYRMMGYEPGSVTPGFQAWAGRLHPDDADAAIRRWRHSVEYGGEFNSEFRVVWPDGSVRWLEARGITERDGANPSVRSYGVMLDISERKRVEQLMGALNRINAAIHSTRDFAEMARRLLEEGTAALECNSAAIALRQHDGWICAYVHAMPAELVGLRMSDEEERHALLAIESRQPVVVSNVAVDDRVNRAHLQRHGIGAVMVVPLITRGKPFGGLYFNYRTAYAFRKSEVDFARQLGTTAAIAIENAHLFEHRRQAENELQTLNAMLEQRVADRTQAIQTLHDVASMANQSQDPLQATEYCVQRVAAYNGWCAGHALFPVLDDPDQLDVPIAWYADDPERYRDFHAATLQARFRRGCGLPGRVLASGKPEWTTNLQRDLTGNRAVVAARLGLRTGIVLPVPVGERVVGVLEFFSRHVVEPSRDMFRVMVGVGLQLGRVFERAGFEEHLLTAADDIRRCIAQDLHDDVGQELTGLGLKAETLAESLTTESPRVQALAADVAAAVGRTHDKIRCLSRSLLLVELEGGLLADALTQLAATTTDSSRLACVLDCTHPRPVFDNWIAVQLYRIAQEAVTNAMRHSGGQHIRISLNEEQGETILRIEDDGTGLPPNAGQAEGMGLRIMRQRARLIGGRLDVRPRPERGTQVVCRFVARAAAQRSTAGTRQ